MVLLFFEEEGAAAAVALLLVAVLILTATLEEVIGAMFSLFAAVDDDVDDLVFLMLMATIEGLELLLFDFSEDGAT